MAIPTPIAPPVVPRIYIPANPIQQPQFYKMIEQITQMVIRILFVASAILISAYAAPLAISSYVVTVVSIGATTLSGFFFPQGNSYLGRPLQAQIEYKSLARPTLGAVELPPGAPRGLRNIGNNCFLNSLFHFIDSEPQLAAWFRNPLNDLEGFINFFNDYPQPPNFMNDFQNYILERQPLAQNLAVQQQEHAQDPVQPIQIPPLDLFRDFLDQYAIDPQHTRVFNSLSESFEVIYRLQVPFARFYRQYDEPLRSNLNLSGADTQQLRRALVDFKTWLPRGNVQLDAEEVLRIFLGALPVRLMAQIEVTKNLGNPYGEGRAAEYSPPIYNTQPFIEMSIPPGDGPFDLKDVFEAWHLERTEHEPVNRFGVDGEERKYPIQTCSQQFLAAPPALRIMLKRFSKAPSSILTRLFSSLWPQLPYAKNSAPVNAPEFLTIQTKDGERHRYRLASFVTHIGRSREYGHYVAGEIREGEKYLENDVSVTQVKTDSDNRNWDEQLRSAYLLNYLPFQEALQPVHVLQ